MMEQADRKVTANHLQRKAYLYVRQSTLQQVRRHQESTHRQYALRRKAEELGWPGARIVVIDNDLGQSGASTVDRQGFQRLVAEVSMGNAGIVLGLEVSRLARNNSDWHKLLEICGVTRTLILDEDGLYDPCEFNDRLLLGLKGAMSEAELHILKARMRGGVLSKARRGELHLYLPVGLVYDEEGEVILDPDKQVQDSLRLLFATYRRVGTAQGVAVHFGEEGLLFPRYPHGRTDKELVWKPLSSSLVRDTLHNPRYTGAYVYGRTRCIRTGDGRIRHVRKPREEWLVFIPNAHEGYISWQEFEENERQLESCRRDKPGEKERQSAPREGCALLQGLVLCGVCGRRMTVAYHKRCNGPVPDYSCRSQQGEYGGSRCQGVIGTGVDEAVSDLLVESLTPMTLEVALSVQEELQRRSEEADRIRRQQVERTQYEVDLAQRRYMQVDPENRLVAQSLEDRWNEKLLALEKAKEEYDRLCREDRLVMDEQKRKDILALATDFPRLWRDRRVSNRERKRMIRLLIEDVTLIVGDTHVTIHVRFKGGATRTLSVPKPLPAWAQKQTDPAVIKHIDRLLDDHIDDEIASILNEQGLRTGAGLPFTGMRVSLIRRRHGIKNRYKRLRERGMLTPQEVADRLGIFEGTVRKWQKKGLLIRHAYVTKKYLYEPPADIHAYGKEKHFKNRPKAEDLKKNQQHSNKEVQCEG